MLSPDNQGEHTLLREPRERRDASLRETTVRALMTEGRRADHNAKGFPGIWDSATHHKLHSKKLELSVQILIRWSL
jgi:hypothetical protein